ncbi:unnamed protein product [Adineta steineri]|uniref:NAD(P)(+)--arginine ADP-ribosyltransferase n=1 Tax=Adineta steineri TaxID=433720 RepID=A0A815FM70_9BILA|nr:unnamed protein product [Adineta steineri]CAF4077919.1 unnamed protein product [Adineta steineri]
MTTDKNADAQHYARVSDIAKEPQKMLMPIRGYEEMPIVPLEEAVAPLVSILPKIQDYVHVAKQRCESVPPDDLTQDESASIMLYSMDWEPHEECLYFALNATLRTEDRSKLKTWFSYLKLILIALEKLPSTRCNVFRGVNLNLSEQYTEGKTFIWWGFSSCTTSMGVLENEQFFGKTGERTMFTIECDSGKDISRHSYYQKEKEVLLLPARRFVVVSCLQPAPGLHMIQLKETKPVITLLQPVTNQSVEVKPSPSFEKKDKPQTMTDPVPPETNNNNNNDASYITNDLPQPTDEIVKPNKTPDFEEEAVRQQLAPPVPPNVSKNKDSAGYLTTDSSKSTYKITKPDKTPEKQQFATPGTYTKLDCEGRSCIACGKCCDWYFTGDAETWEWIRNWENWAEEDINRWIYDRVYNRFKPRDGATCNLRDNSLRDNLLHHDYTLAGVIHDGIRNLRRLLRNFFGLRAPERHVLDGYAHLLNCVCEDNTFA